MQWLLSAATSFIHLPRADAIWEQAVMAGVTASAASSQLRQETAVQAADLVTRVQSAEHRALVVAALAFAIVALVLWRARWVRRVWLHWAALAVVPAIAVMLWMGGTAASLGDDVRGLPLATLDDIRSDPTLGSFAGAVVTARELCLASEHGTLGSALAFRPALEALAITIVLGLGIWGWTNRRVLAQRGHFTR